MALTFLRAGPDDEFLDLGLTVMAMFSLVGVALAWAGAMAGAMIWAGK